MFAVPRGILFLTNHVASNIVIMKHNLQVDPKPCFGSTGNDLALSSDLRGFLSRCL